MYHSFCSITSKATNNSKRLLLVLKAHKTCLISFLTTLCHFIDAAVLVNGLACKDVKDVKVDEFFLAADLDKPRDMTMSKVKSNVTLINVMKLAGLNTLGISMARIDYAPQGQNPPHTHPRATEILTVLEGSLYVGFVTSLPESAPLPCV
jgi:hypothetical protein